MWSLTRDFLGIPLYAYLVLFLVDCVASGAWIWGTSRVTGLEFPRADLVITVVFCSLLALLPAYGWLLAMVVLWLILRGTRRADLWPDVLLMAGGAAVIWLVTAVSAIGLAS